VNKKQVGAWACRLAWAAEIRLALGKTQLRSKLSMDRFLLVRLA